MDAYSMNQYTSLRDFIKQRHQQKSFVTQTIATFGGADFDGILNMAEMSNNKEPNTTFQPSLPRDLEDYMQPWNPLPGTKKETNIICLLYTSPSPRDS